jgi:DNA polymerase III sliding clamp (beta) subunit (PCNA family)
MATLVHITPTKIEACDNHRLFVAGLKTGFPQSVCIPAISAIAVSSLPITHVSIGEGWAHFKEEEGGTVAVRTSQERYHKSVEDLLKMDDPKQVKLPSNMAELVERAQVMNESDYDSKVMIKVADGQLTIMSRKDSGWYRERKKVKYTGTPLRFSVHPKFLADVLKRTDIVSISKDRLKLTVENVEFVVLLDVTTKDEE